jgi:hypothetical protein
VVSSDETAAMAGAPRAADMVPHGGGVKKKARDRWDSKGLVVPPQAANQTTPPPGLKKEPAAQNRHNKKIQG